jgi:D-3-phosphoglycerate dehydrogenase
VEEDDVRYRCAVLDDYQNIALASANWSGVTGEIDVTVFNEPFAGLEAAKKALAGFNIICAMRERTPFPRELITALPDLKLLITTGARNASFDLAAAAERGVLVCSTGSYGNPTVGIVFGLMLELTRRIGFENARMKAGASWQVTLGTDLEGLTLGIVGLGKLGRRVATVAQAFGMKVIAWSQNLTADACRAAGVAYAAKEELFAAADVVSVHVILSPRSRGLIGAGELALMKPTAYLINTARGPIVDEGALIAALAGRRIAGAGLDVFATEPLPVDHPLRRLDNVVLTPHLGYVSRQNYARFFADTVEDIRAFLDGNPIRVISAA